MGEYVDAYVVVILMLKIFKPLKLVIQLGNGAAGHVIDAIEARFKAQGVPLEFIKVHHQPDGTFPNGIPNPLLPECRADTANAVLDSMGGYGASPSMATLIAASCLTKKATLSRVIILSACWLRLSWKNSRARNYSRSPPELEHH